MRGHGKARSDIHGEVVLHGWIEKVVVLTITAVSIPIACPTVNMTAHTRNGIDLIVCLLSDGPHAALNTLVRVLRVQPILGQVVNEQRLFCRHGLLTDTLVGSTQDPEGVIGSNDATTVRTPGVVEAVLLATSDPVGYATGTGSMLTWQRNQIVF